MTDTYTQAEAAPLNHPALAAAARVDSQDDVQGLRLEAAVTNLLYLVAVFEGRKETTYTDMDKKRRILAILGE